MWLEYAQWCNKTHNFFYKWICSQLTWTVDILFPPLCKYSNNWIFKESMNLFVLPLCCDSQAWSSPVCSRTDRIRSTSLWIQCHLAQVAFCRLTGWFCDRSRILHQYFTAFICCLIINGNCPVSPYIAGVGVCFLAPRVDLINLPIKNLECNSRWQGRGPWGSG